MKKILTLVLIIISATGYSQVHRYVKVQYDSSKIVTPYALSTALAPQTVTYAQLITAISAKTLITDRSYILSDFRTVYKVYGGLDTASGSVEPLILTATSDSTVSITAFSPKYPNDVIHYSVTDNSPLAPTSGSKGVILFRKDALNNLSTYYDWRVVKWRRWALAAGGIYLAFTKNTPAIATDSSMSFTFGTNNTNISIGGDSWNIVIGDNNNSIKIGSDVGIFGSGVNIGSSNSAITIDDDCATVQTSGSGYIGGIFISSSNRYINIGKRSYNISIGSNCYAIDLGLQNSDIAIPDNTIRKRIEKGFSNFEATVALSGKTANLYNTTVYSLSPYLYSTANYCGIINLTSVNSTDTLDYVYAQQTSLAFSDISIRPASGLSLLVRDKSVATTVGSNIDFGGYNLLVNGTTKKYFKIHKNITNTYGSQPNDFYLSYTNVASGIGGVPYTGATQDVNLGEFGLQTGNVEFDNTPTNLPTANGSMYYNDSDGTLDLILKGGNVKLQIGQESVVRVVNKTATNINLLEANYQAVRVTGAQGQRSKVDLAQATSDTFSAETIGLVTETINNNQEGYITTSGLVRNINTTGSLQGETWADGDMLYLSPTTAGSLTKVKPVAPNHLVVIGYVIHAHITQGSVFVKVDNGYELDELHNVKITTPSNNQALVFNDTTDVWENKSLVTVSSYGKNATADSTILLLSNGTRYAAKDSVGGGGGSNIYTADGTLTSARTVTLNSLPLTIAGTTPNRFHANGNMTFGPTESGGTSFSDSSYKLSLVNTNLNYLRFKRNVGGADLLQFTSSSDFTTARINAGGFLHISAANSISIGGTGRLTLGANISEGLTPVSIGYETWRSSAASAILDIRSTTQGILIPRMTLTQRNAIATPAAGLQVIVTGETGGEFVSFYNGTTAIWERIIVSRSSVIGSVFIGNTSGNSATNATNSNFLGSESGSGATNASASNFFGGEAGKNASAANNSNFFGSAAGKNATSAQSSNFFGLSAGELASSALQSNFLGTFAGYAATNASGSNFFGVNAGVSATNATNSNFFGRLAGNGATGANHSNFFGFNVGNSSRHAITGANNILIGTNITTPTAATANSANIGGVLYLTGTYGTTTGAPQATAQTAGKVGINTTTPVASAALEIVSTTAGVLFPRMTTAEKTAIGTPAAGLQVYDTTLNQMSYYNGTTWVNF